VSVEGYRRRQTKLPLGRGASPEEIAAAVLTIIDTPMLTGQMLALDGGEHLEWPDRRGPTPRKPAK
jgi:NAD(P)-dependent dehydrogenase (short-subunit alcohol dehydrogenase family)